MSGNQEAVVQWTKEPCNTMTSVVIQVIGSRYRQRPRVWDGHLIYGILRIFPTKESYTQAMSLSNCRQAKSSNAICSDRKRAISPTPIQGINTKGTSTDNYRSKFSSQESHLLSSVSNSTTQHLTNNSTLQPQNMLFKCTTFEKIHTLIKSPQALSPSNPSMTGCSRHDITEGPTTRKQLPEEGRG